VLKHVSMESHEVALKERKFILFVQKICKHDFNSLQMRCPVIDVWCWPPTVQTLDFKNVLLSQTTFMFLCIRWTVNIYSILKG